MNEKNNLIDIFISVFLKQKTYFPPGFRSNALIIENLENTEKYNEEKISSMNASLNIFLFRYIFLSINTHTS